MKMKPYLMMRTVSIGIFHPRDGRSTLHDRSRSNATSELSITKPPDFEGGGSMSTGSSPPPGFLDYSLGQNGPGPVTGSSIERSHQIHNHDGHESSEVGHFVPVGRDVSGAEVSMSSGLPPYGGKARYGSNIEAVSKNETKKI